MSEPNTIVIKTHPIKKITLSLNGKEYEIPAYMSMNDIQLFSEEKKESKDYKRAIAAVILEKINANEAVSDIEEIYNQDDVFFSDFIVAVVENDVHIESKYASASEELSEIDRFGVTCEEYIRDMTNRMVDAIKPIAESYSQFAKSVDLSGAFTSFQESMKNIGKNLSESMSGIKKMTKIMADSMDSFRRLSETIGTTLSSLHFYNITEEEIYKWKMNYKRWGEIGWTVLPNASFNLFKEILENESSAHKVAMSYCDKEAMDFIFSDLAKKKIKKIDLESAIFCYYNKQYKACVLLLFGIIDSKLIKAQPKETNRKVGYKATRIFEKMFEKSEEEQFLFAALYQINLLSCLDTYFASGENFLKEPNAINRNYIDHGMNIRAVRKRDCVQLFLALYNLCEIMNKLL